MAKSIPLTASCGALRLCRYLPFQFSFMVCLHKDALSGTEDIRRVYARRVNPCPVNGSEEQEATCPPTKLPDQYNSHLSPSAWGGRDDIHKTNDIFKPCAHICHVKWLYKQTEAK